MNESGPLDQLSIDMYGSEWFRTRSGGLNRYFTELFTALQRRTDVSVRGFAFGSPPANGETWGPAGLGLPGRIRASRRHRVHTTQVIDRHFALYGTFGRRMVGTVHIEHFQGPWAAESLVAGESVLSVVIKRTIERLRYRRVQHFIVLSRSFAQILITDFGIPPERISVIPPGVDVNRFSLTDAPREDSPRVLCVRRLENRMGIDVLLRAWPSVLEVVPDARLEIIGTGTAEARLHELAEVLGLGDSVTFRGAVSDDDLHAAYAKSWVTVVPTLALEGFGLIALESLASGRPPIVTNCGGLPDAVEGLDGTLVVPAGDSAALAARIADALNGNVPTEFECRIHAERFSWDEVASRHVDLYWSLLRARRAT